MPPHASARLTYPAAADKHDGFLAINPLGQLPALQDDSLCLRDSHAILVYIASRVQQLFDTLRKLRDDGCSNLYALKLNTGTTSSWADYLQRPTV